MTNSIPEAQNKAVGQITYIPERKERKSLVQQRRNLRTQALTILAFEFSASIRLFSDADD